MNDQHLWRALLWKEWRVVMPLVIGVAVIALILQALGSVSLERPDSHLLAVFILVPNLAALGLSAIQVGHEEEVGTLNWQRTLPVTSLTVLISKIAVALLAIALLWVVAATGFLVFSEGSWGRLGDTIPLMNEGSVFLSVVVYAAFTLKLYTISLFSAWLLRSPAAGIVLTAVLVTLTMFITLELTHVSDNYVSGSNIDKPSTAVWQIFYSLAFAAIYTVLAFRCARNRWYRSQAVAWWSSDAVAGESAVASHPAYRAVNLGGEHRPNRAWALVWQSFRQSRAAFVCALCVILLQLVAMAMDRSQRLHAILAYGCPLLAIGLLGSVAFAADSKQQRYRFLADRGLSQLAIWSSRCLLPALLAFIIWALAMYIAFDASNQYTNNKEIQALMFLGVGAFLSGVISGMWARRPIVGYLGWPLLLVCCAFYFGMVAVFYGEYLQLLFLPAAIATICSLRMARRWSDGDSGIGYHGRFMGWLGIALLVVPLIIVGLRVSDMPPAQTSWRTEMFAQTKAMFDQGVSNSHQLVQSEDAVPDVDERTSNARQSAMNLLQRHYHDGGESFLSRFHEHLAGQGSALDQSVSSNEAIDAQFYAVIETMRAFRNYQLVSLQQSDNIDKTELMLSRMLSVPEIRTFIDDSRWNEAVEILRTSEERARDRRQALLWSWHAMVLGQDEQEFGTFNGIMGYWHPANRLVFGIEQTRYFRLADIAVQISLKQVETPPASDSAASQARRAAWDAVMHVDPTYKSVEYYQPRPTSHWNAEFEQAVNSVLQKYVPAE
jgi:hypothetical protein